MEKKTFIAEPVNDVFTFWLENKTSKEFKLLSSEMIPKFLEWICKKERQWLEYYGSEQVVIAFITDKDGLNSTFDNSDLDKICRILKPYFKVHLKS